MKLVLLLTLVPALAFASDKVEPQPDGSVIVTSSERPDANTMAVYPAAGIAGRPLLMAVHGNGGTGPGEIKGWMDLAKQHNFTVVCPSLRCPVHSKFVPDDQPYFRPRLHWIEDNVQYDKSNAYMTGFSGGGFAVWYLGAEHPEFFHGLITQSGNYSGEIFGLEFSRWFHRPIKLIWGTEDAADIPGQNGQVVDSLKAERCKDFTTEIVQGGHHEEHNDKVVAWMEQEMANQSGNH